MQSLAREKHSASPLAERLPIPLHESQALLREPHIPSTADLIRGTPLPRYDPRHNYGRGGAGGAGDDEEDEDEGQGLLGGGGGDAGRGGATGWLTGAPPLPAWLSSSASSSVQRSTRRPAGGARDGGGFWGGQLGGAGRRGAGGVRRTNVRGIKAFDLDLEPPGRARGRSLWCGSCCGIPLCEALVILALLAAALAVLWLSISLSADPAAPPALEGEHAEDAGAEGDLPPLEGLGVGRPHVDTPLSSKDWARPGAQGPPALGLVAGAQQSETEDWGPAQPSSAGSRRDPGPQGEGDWQAEGGEEESGGWRPRGGGTVPGTGRGDVPHESVDHYRADAGVGEEGEAAQEATGEPWEGRGHAGAGEGEVSRGRGSTTGGHQKGPGIASGSPGGTSGSPGSASGSGAQGSHSGGGARGPGAGAEAKGRPASLWRGVVWAPLMGAWLRRCGGESQMLPVKEVLHAKECRSKCNGVGVCRADTGTCACRIGYKGADCSQMEEHQCGAASRGNGSGNTTFSPEEEEGEGMLAAAASLFSMPFGMPAVPFEMRTADFPSSPCAAECDPHSGLCLCGADSLFPTRPVPDPCAFNKDLGGSVSRESAGVAKEGLYAQVGGRNKFPGWCNANPKDILESAKGANEARLLCSCDYDGALGLFCHIPVQSFCVNQCSGRGVCSHGHCQCARGWYGVDCSIPSKEAMADPQLPAWLLPDSSNEAARGPRPVPGQTRSLPRSRTGPQSQGAGGLDLEALEGGMGSLAGGGPGEGGAGGDKEGEREPNVDQAYAELGMKAHPRGTGAGDTGPDAASAAAMAGADAWRGGSAGGGAASSHGASGRGESAGGQGGVGESSLGHSGEEVALTDPLEKGRSPQGEGKGAPRGEGEKPPGTGKNKQGGAAEGQRSGSGKVGEAGDSAIGRISTSNNSTLPALGSPGAALLTPPGLPEGTPGALSGMTFSSEGGAEGVPVRNSSSPGPQALGSSQDTRGSPELQQQQVDQGKPKGRRRLLSGPEQGTRGVAASGSVLKGGDVVQETQKRQPLVYIYELPPEFNTHLLQGRQKKSLCVPRLYDELNRTQFASNFRYGLEVVLHEGLLISPHRTSNPEEADFFFVPVYGSCLMERLRHAETVGLKSIIPRSMKGSRAWFLAEFYGLVQRHVQQAHPFWNRTGGRDHLWPTGLDEGGCGVPRAVWPATVLSHWGNTGRVHRGVFTAVGQEMWTAIPVTLHGMHRCFNPRKDIVMPAWTPPNVEHLHEQYWARPPSERPTLFYYAGDLGYSYKEGRPELAFSLGIRQALARAFASVPDMRGQLGQRHTEGVVVVQDKPGDHGQQMGNSKFCGVVPGDGFTSSMEEAMMHGCIPVIIQDGVQLAFENYFDFSSFSVRVPEDEIPSLVSLLTGMTPAKVASLHHRVASTWQRWVYHSVMRAEAMRQQQMFGHNEAWAFGSSMLKDEDAMDTLIEILFAKLHTDRWRQAGSALGRNAETKRDRGVPMGCSSGS